MNITNFVCALIVAIFFSTAVQAQQDTPNIIFIVADDIGYGDSSIYNKDSKIPMPNLARLAKEGMTFTRAYTVAPKCAPSRYSFLAGNYQWRGYKSWGQWNFKGGSQFLPGQKTVADLLQESHATSVVGKYHLGGDFFLKGSDEYASEKDDESLVDFGRGVESGAKSHGFDYSYLLLRGIQDTPYAYFENDKLSIPEGELIKWAKGWYNNRYSYIDKAGVGAPDYDSSEVDSLFIDAALEHLNAVVSQPNPRPFFLYYPAVAAHVPQTPSDYLHGVPIRGTQFSSRSDMIFSLDNQLGLILEFLDQHNLAKDTLIVFTSDNGGGMSSRQSDIDVYGHDRNGGLRGGKSDIWEGGVRVPLVVRWGDGTTAGSTIKPGVVSDALIALQDLPATFYASAGGSAEYEQLMDSFNMLPELFNPGKHSSIRQSVVLEARDRDGQGVPKHFAIVDQSWKLILNGSDLPEALFDLRVDSGESNNIVSDLQLADTVEVLRNKLLLLRTAERTAPLQNLTSDALVGEPVLERGGDKGIYLWKLTEESGFHLSIHSNGDNTLTEVEVVADQDFEEVLGVSLEGRDVLDWQAGNRILLRSYTSNAADGFTARLPPGSSAMVIIKEGSDIQRLYYGDKKATATPNAWFLPITGLSHDGSSESEALLTNISVAGSTDGEALEVRWRGDGSASTFAVSLLFTEEVSQATPYRFEQKGDWLVTKQKGIESGGYVGKGIDGVNVSVAGTANMGFFFTLNNYIPSHIVNLPSGLGPPNAYRFAL